MCPLIANDNFNRIACSISNGAENRLGPAHLSKEANFIGWLAVAFLANSAFIVDRARLEPTTPA